MRIKHTPGQWVVTGWNLVFGSKAVEINVHFDSGVSGTLEMHANANLIAAAPDLLEALSEVVEWLEHGDHAGPMHSKARAAIAKAKGEEQ